MKAQVFFNSIIKGLIADAHTVKHFPPFRGVRDFTGARIAPLFALDLFFLLAIIIYIAFYYTPGLVFSPTIITGGDAISHYFTAEFLKTQLLPHGKISGWCHGNLGGFPMLQYYFPLPFVLMVIISTFTGLAAAFKTITVLGVFMLPISVYVFFRLLRQAFPVPIAGAALSLVFLFNEGNKMWGGNIPSTLAGEFCYSLGFALAVLWLGLVFRAMEKRDFRHILLCSLLLTLVGLSHAYALLFAGFGSGFFLLTKRDFKANLNMLLKIHGLAFCFLGFWILPLAGNLPWTTKFNILWIFHSWGQAAEEIFPVVMRPAIALSAAALLKGILSSAIRRQGNKEESRAFTSRPGAYALALTVCGLAMYFAGYRARVVDVRFLPFFQLFLIIGAAFLFGGFSLKKGRRLAPAFLAAAVVLSTILWVDGKETFVRDWIRASYKGIDSKPLWEAYKAVNDHLAGSPDDPRVMYEHSLVHQGAGSVRAFENLPLFSGRSTLEGVYIQASVTAPFVFYIQSETCFKPSTPIPEVFFSRFNLERAVEHLKFFNASQFIAAEQATKLAIDESDLFILEFMHSPYRVYGIENSPRSYVEQLEFQPVLLGLEDWMHKAYKWFRLGDLNVVPVFADEVQDREKQYFVPGEEADMGALPAVSTGRTSAPAPKAVMGRNRISVTGAAPGRPLLVKASYHPGWRSSGGERIYLAGPGFMLIIPRSADFDLTYGPTKWDYWGKGLTIAAVLWVILCLVPLFSGVTARISAAFDRHAWKGAVPLLCVLGVLTGAFLLSEAPEFPAEPYNVGLEHFRSKDYEAARQVFADVLQKHGQSLIAGEAAYHLAMTHYLQKNYGEAARALERMMNDYPESPRAAEAWYHLGLCKLKQRRILQASQAFERTAAEFPGSVWARHAAYQHAMIFFRSKDFRRAKESLDRLIFLDPEPDMAAEAHFHRGLCLMELGESKEARKDFDKTVGSYKNTVWAQNAEFLRGVTFFRDGDHANAVRSFKEMLARNPGSPRAAEAWYHLGLSHMKLGETEEAKAAFGKAAEFSNTPWAGHARARIKELNF